LVVTGHSLGGALATHALVALTNAGIKVDQYYSFGSPRVGDPNFFLYVKSLFPGAKWRVTHDHDPVPHLPMEI
jgi:predicted lipase